MVMPSLRIRNSTNSSSELPSSLNLIAIVANLPLGSTFYRWMLSASTSTEWVLPVLYTVTRDLKRIATLVSGLSIQFRSVSLTLRDDRRMYR